MTCVIAAVVAACGGFSAPTGEGPASDAEPDVGADQQLRGGALVVEQAVVAGGVAGVGDVMPVVGVTVPVPLLEETILPCVPLEGVEHGPCGPGVPPGVANPGVAGSIPSWVLDPPSVQQIMEGFGVFFLIPHIVVRATVLPDTTRCEGYLIAEHDYMGGEAYGKTRLYYCFADVRVNEYIVGEGPAKLTVGLNRNTFINAPGHRWDNEFHRNFVIEEEFGNPAVGVAEAYEGREVVLFLQVPMTRAVEAWQVAGYFDLWFVLENTASGGGTEYSAAYRYENRVVSQVGLDDLVASVKAAAPVRQAAVQATTTTTVAGGVTSTTAVGGSGGRQAEGTSTTVGGVTSTTGVMGTTQPIGERTTGSIRGLPFIVDRADRLRDFYVAEGAVYEGEGATVLPPPAPVPPGVPTNVELSQVGDRWLLNWDAPDGGPVDVYYLWLLSEFSQDYTRSFYNVPNGADREYEVTYIARLFSDDFTVQVRAANDYGTSEWSTLQTFTTPTSS